MKVLHYIASKVWGGAEKSFTELCNELSAYMEIVVVLPKENKIESRLNKKIKIYKVSNGSRYSLKLYMELKKIIKKENPDIVHTHSAKASEIVYRLNKITPFIQIATKRNSRKGKIFGKIEYVTAISEAVKRSIFKEDVKVIYNGVIKEDRKNIESKTETKERFHMLSIGGLDKIKGFDLLIKEVSKLDFPFVLEIIGDGSQKESLQKLIEELNLSDRVKLIGYKENVPDFISQADVVIVSSISEGFSRVVVESMFYGKLLISTKVGISVEILPEELLYDMQELSQKLTDIYGCKERYLKLFESVKIKYSDKFELKNNITEYIEFYDDVLKRVEGDRK